MQPVEIPIEQLQAMQDAYPREEASGERVALFREILEQGDELPPIDVVKLEEGRYLISDGVHRFYAAMRARHRAIAVNLIKPIEGESTLECAYRHAVETASKTALPLTYAERRKAVGRLLETRPDLSHRAIGRIIGISHDTVGRWSKEMSDRSEEADEGQDEVQSLPSAAEISNRLVRYLNQLDESRDLFDYFKPSRMGRHLADAFDAYHGDYSLREARRMAQWVASAVSYLEGAGD